MSAAVEAALAALFPDKPAVDGFTRNVWLPTITTILEAAAPHMLAGRVEWSVLERPTMGATFEESQRIIPMRSESDARNAARTRPSIYVGVASRTVTEWHE
ncbi:MAG TPA: hypothetical protein DEV93_03410 [Chloroflexi bacterium]|jgi:hypothetical protein|nr:hypothetical protein [Chloroflexota bacterium]